ncbi:MAG: DUF4329 domain-containing protein [Clostridia bacterium]|nr:DUF4329 domain-containing protein [Clostridia bacterium]
MSEDNAWSTPDTVLEDGISYEYDTLGNVTSVKKSTWNSASGTELANRTKTPEVTYTYDNHGRLATESSSVGGKATGKSYSYNQFGAETGFTLTVNGIEELEKISAYDDLLRLESVTQDGETTTYTYDDNGNLLTETTGDVVTTYTYNDSNMVVSMGTTADGTVVTDFDYLYNRNGNQSQKIDNVTGVVTTYEYDLIGQLTEEQKTNGTTVTLKDSYTYDASGNRLTKVEERPDTLAKTVASTYNKNNQLTSTTTDGVVNNYTYDNVGNMLTDGAKAYTYSSRNQQKTYSDEDTSASYTYYYDGLRKSKTVGTDTTYFIWHNGNMVYEFTPNDSNSYTYGHRLISSDDAKYVLNAHGDVVALLKDVEYEDLWHEEEDGNNLYVTYTVTEVVKRYDYDAFGNELNIDNTDTNPFRYCAEYFDTETGTIYLRARYYSPVTGRFTQLDPIKDGLNWYAYCTNNPVRWVDRMGLAPGNEFDSADDAAIDFGKTYNEESIEFDTEYGSVIYKVTVYKTKKVQKKFLWFIPYTVTKIDYNTVEKSYYTYSKPITGEMGKGSVKTSNVPISDNAATVHEEVAQIHTHGAYHHEFVTSDGNRNFVRDYNGFSEDDINIARKRKVNTYVVTQWGDLFKATYVNDYTDKNSPYIMDAFTFDPKIVELYGSLYRY